MATDMLPPDPDLPLLHTRNYEVRAFRKDDETLVLRGAVKDTKPAGLYVPDDTEPLVIHHMIVDLTVAFPSLEITDASVVFEAHPHTTCTSITDHYTKLIGLSIARGFTHRVRELFGGPRGCTHTTALLQAMAPVAVQCFWSMQVLKARETGSSPRPPVTTEERQRMMRMNLNTCHVWAEDGVNMARINAGEPLEPPLQIVRRFRELGKDPGDWVSQLRPADE
jgi:hypothetical protein